MLPKEKAKELCLFRQKGPNAEWRLARTPEDSVFVVMPFAVIGLRKAKFGEILSYPHSLGKRNTPSLALLQ